MRFSARPGSRTASARRRGATRDSRGICADALVRVRSGFASGRSRTSGRVRTHHADGDAFAGISRVPREIPEERDGLVRCARRRVRGREKRRARGRACEERGRESATGARIEPGVEPRPPSEPKCGTATLRWTHCWFAGPPHGDHPRVREIVRRAPTTNEGPFAFLPNAERRRHTPARGPAATPRSRITRGARRLATLREHERDRAREPEAVPEPADREENHRQAEVGHGVPGVPRVHGRVHESPAGVHGGVHRREVRRKPRGGAHQVRGDPARDRRARTRDRINPNFTRPARPRERAPAAIFPSPDAFARRPGVPARSLTSTPNAPQV